MDRQALVRNGRSDNPFRIGYIAAPQLLAIGPFPCFCPIFHCLCGRFVRLTVASLFSELARESDWHNILHKITAIKLFADNKLNNTGNVSKQRYFISDGFDYRHGYGLSPSRIRTTKITVNIGHCHRYGLPRSPSTTPITITTTTTLQQQGFKLRRLRHILPFGFELRRFRVFYVLDFRLIFVHDIYIIDKFRN